MRRLNLVASFSPALHSGHVTVGPIRQGVRCTRRAYGVLYRTTPPSHVTPPSPLAMAGQPTPSSSEKDSQPPSATSPQQLEGGTGPQEGVVDNTKKTPKKEHLKTGDTFKESSGVLVSTRGTIAGHKIVKEVGIVVGSSVKSRHVGHDLWARVLGFFGSSIVSYAEMMVDSSAEATYNLMQEASKRGANAVLRVRYETAASSDPAVWSSTFSYTLAYGTAVVVKPAKGNKKADRRATHNHSEDD